MNTRGRGYVEPVRRADGTPAVLKIVPPGDRELDAAEWFAGHGAPQVLEIDRAQGALLLERVLPGTMLVDEPEESAVAAVAGLGPQLWRPPAAGCPFPSVRDWGGSLQPGSRAAGVFFELCDSMDEPVVLHGDLHHFNVLRADREPWLAIDPKGLVGDRAFEVAAFLRNPAPRPLDMLRRRLTLLTEALDLDPGRTRDWCFVEAMLNAAWSHDAPGGEFDARLAWAELMLKL